MKPTSSTPALLDETLQADPLSAWKLNSCPVCRDSKMPGPCNGAHAVVIDDDCDSDDDAIGNAVMDESSDEETEVDEENTEDRANDREDESYHELLMTHGLFNAEIISMMLSERQLHIDNQPDSHGLSIKLSYKPEWLSTKISNELRKFIDVLLKELEEFKKEHGLTDNCFTILKDSQGNFLSLRINLPDLALYQAFIIRLSSKNLLPAQTVKQLEKTTYEKGMNHFLTKRPSPRPTLSRKRKADIEDDENLENTYRRLSPFSTRPSPYRR